MSGVVLRAPSAPRLGNRGNDLFAHHTDGFDDTDHACPSIEMPDIAFDRAQRAATIRAKSLI